MAAEISDDNTGQSTWLPWQLGIVSLACMFCIVFMGLKFKWFRAQLNFGESKRSKASPVEGIGFKLKTNPDDFQSYKVISEFAETSVPVRQAQPNVTNYQNKINRSHSYSEEKLSSLSNEKPTLSVQKPSTTLEKNTTKSKSMEKLSTKHSFITQSTMPSKPDVKYQETVDKKDEPQGNIAQIINPLFETHNSSMSSRSPDAFVEEKPKSRNLYDDEPVDDDDSYFAGGSTIYSNQAASIFFGGRSLGEDTNTARTNYLSQVSDNESIGSDTSA